MHMKQKRQNCTHDCINDYTTILCISNRAKRMFIHLNRLYIGRDIELYALVPHSYLLQLKRRRVLGLTLKRLYIGAYGTFKFKWSYIFRYVWIDNFHGYRLVSSKVWRKCYAAVWRTIYSSKFAYFGKYIDAYLYAYETIASKLYTRLHKWLYHNLVHFKSCKKNVYSSESVVYWPRYRALCTCTSLLPLTTKERRPVLVLTLKRLYIGAYGTFKFKWSYIFRYVWIDNFHGYRLVSSKVWRKCYAAVWRTIYSSKFAYFGEYIDAYLYAYETIAS